MLKRPAAEKPSPLKGLKDQDGSLKAMHLIYHPLFKVLLPMAALLYYSERTSDIDAQEAAYQAELDAAYHLSISPQTT